MRNMVRSSLVDLMVRQKAILSFQSMTMLIPRLHTLNMGHF